MNGKETVLVTGGAGFMGSHVAEDLLASGYAVVVLDDLSGGDADNVPSGAVFIEGSITDSQLVDSLFDEHGFRYVYHLAAYAAEGLSHFIRRFNYTNNLIGSVNLINASVRTGVECFVFTSSIAVYGALEPPFTEEDRPQPEDPYAIAKYAVEMDLQVAHEMWGLDFIVFRPHNVYGERQNTGDKYRNVIGIFMNQILQERDLTVFGDGSQTRAFTYIGDVAPVIARAVTVPGARNNVFNIGADTPYSVKELAEVVIDAMEADVNLHHLPARYEVVHAVSDHSKAQEILGYKADTPLAEGIGRMAKWSKTVGPRKGTVFSGIEIDINLPEVWR